MAAPRDQEIRLVATDKASKVIEKVADQLEELDKQGDAAIEITADDKATAEIKSISQRLAGLSDEDKTIIIRAQVADAEKDVARILRSLGRLDEMDDEEVTIRVDALGNARQRLDEVQRELADLDGETATVKVEGKGIDDLTDKLGALPGVLGQLGGAGTAGGIAALATGMFALASSSKDLAINAQVTADLTGSTVEEASKLQSIWSRTGADVNDLNDVLLQMNGVLSTTPELAAELGINLNDGKNIAERFVQVTDMLAAGQLSAQQASQLFGEEGVRQVGKLRTLYGGLSDDLENMPPPVDDDDVANAIEMEKSVGKMTTTLKTAASAVGMELVPLFADLSDIANKMFTSLPGEQKDANAAKWAHDWMTGIGLITRGAAEVNDALGGDGFKVSVAPDLGKGIEELAGQTRDYTQAGRDARDVMIEQVNAKLDEQMADIAEETERAAAAAERHARALQDEYDRQTAIADAFRTSADAQADAREATAAYGLAIAGYGQAVKDAEGDVFILNGLIDENKNLAIAQADATVAAYVETLKSQGITMKASEATGLWNSEMLKNAATAEGPLRASILEYIGTVNGIPEEKLTEIEAALAAGDIEEAKRLLDEASAKRKAEIAAEATGVESAEAKLNRLARERQARIVVTRVGGFDIVDAGGTVGPEGGLAAEIGPEFAQLPGGRKVLLTQPSFVPPGTKVTSRVETARQLKLKRYDSGTGFVSGGTTIIHEHITLNSGVIGNGFDVERKVAQALRQYERRNGRRRP